MKIDICYSVILNLFFAIFFTLSCQIWFFKVAVRFFPRSTMKCTILAVCEPTTNFLFLFSCADLLKIACGLKKTESQSARKKEEKKSTNAFWSSRTLIEKKKEKKRKNSTKFEILSLSQRTVRCFAPGSTTIIGNKRRMSALANTLSQQYFEALSRTKKNRKRREKRFE